MAVFASARVIMLTIDQFGFERRPATFHGRLIVAAAHATETGEHGMPGEQRLILITGGLAARVGMMQQFGRWPTLADRPLQRFVRQFIWHLLIPGPTDQPP